MDSTQHRGRAAAAGDAIERIAAKPWFVPTLLALSTGIAFIRVWAAGYGALPGSTSTDLATYFVYARQFGFSQLAHGHLPLLNPHVAGGVPFLGDWQAAMLYPPNWIYLALPLPIAINIESMGHVFLCALFTSFWLRAQGLHPVAVAVGATSAMLGGPFFLHVYAGHLSAIDAMAWAPLILLAIETLMEKPTLRWMLIGSAALAMQILAGHPQTVFFTIVIGLVYATALLACRSGRVIGLVSCAAAALLALGLGAAQIATGLQAASEGVRPGAVPYRFAASFSFEPRNLLTALAPHLYGGPAFSTYWSAWYPWEMSLYVGVAALLLVCFGVSRSEAPRRTVWAVMAGVSLLLALGSHTALFPILYHSVPGFDKFRSESKFLYECSLFLAGLAAIGLDALLRGARPSRQFVMATGLVAVVLVFGALAMFFKGGSIVESVAGAAGGARSKLPPPGTYSRLAWTAQAARASGWAILVSAAVASAVFLLLRAAGNANANAVYALGSLAVVELTCFAAFDLTSFNIAATRSPFIAQYVRSHPGDYRVLVTSNYNLATWAGTDDIWAYDPAVFGRYVRFMATTQHIPPDSPDFGFPIQHIVTPQAILRLGYIFAPSPGGERPAIYQFPAPLAHAALFHDAALASGGAAALAQVTADQFDPHRSVVLEQPPIPALAPPAGPESVAVRAVSTDEMAIDATVSAPGVLLITDAYSSQYRATAEAGSAQVSYRVIPADYCLIGIPVQAGAHHIDLRYAPRAFEIGSGISVASLVIYGALLAVGLLLRRPGTPKAS